MLYLDSLFLQRLNEDLSKYFGWFHTEFDEFGNLISKKRVTTLGDRFFYHSNGQLDEFSYYGDLEAKGRKNSFEVLA